MPYFTNFKKDKKIMKIEMPKFEILPKKLIFLLAQGLALFNNETR